MVGSLRSVANIPSVALNEPWVGIELIRYEHVSWQLPPPADAGRDHQADS